MADYFNWLCEVVHADDPGQSYIRLMETLHAIEFEWDLPLDEDRAIDGYFLRKKYGSKVDLSKPVSVLETLVALAMRINEEIMWNPIAGDRTSTWFWMMLENLDLDDLDDDHFGTDDEIFIKEKVDIWMFREFRENGEGGIFPLLDPNEDQRNLEIWTQMNLYFLENYGTEEDFYSI